MTTWIQVYSNLPTHNKTYALAGALGLKTNYEAVGIVVCVWAWASVNAHDGDITDFPARAIANAADWRKSPDKLLEALERVGFVDRTEGGRLLIHDWDEYACLLMESIDRQKNKTRERVKRYREKNKPNM